MKTVSKIALGMVLALGGVGAVTLPATVATAQEAEEYQLDLSRKFRKSAAEAQEALATGDQAAIQAAFAEAEANIKEPDDRFFLAQLRVNDALNREDRQGVAQHLDALLNSGSPAVTQEKRIQFLQQLGQLAIEREDNAAAQGYFQQLAEADPNNPDAIFNVGFFQLQGNDTAGAYDSFSKAIALRESQGATPEENWYRQALRLAFENDQIDVVPPSEALVRAYPTADNWRSVLILLRDGATMSDGSELDVYRLLESTGSMSPEGTLNGQRTRSDYIDWAETANSAAYVGEAQAALQLAAAAGDNAAQRPQAKELGQIVGERVGDDKRDLPGLATEAAAEATGELAASTATAYLGYGENEKAIELYELALQKGGVNEAGVNTRIGIAKMRMGDYDGARAAFAAVPEGTTQGALAKLWAVHLEQKAGGGAETAMTTTEG
ncbi:MAG: hypothetical protein AAGD40_00365 [Pseudomonadota bacterium]